VTIAIISYTVDKGRFPSRNGNPAWDRAIIANLGFDGPITGTNAINRGSNPSLEGTARIYTTPEDKEKRDPALYPRSFAIVPWTTNWSNGTEFRGWRNRPFNVGIPYSLLDSPERAALVVQGHHGIGGPPNYLGSIQWAFKDMSGPADLLGQTQQVLFADGHIGKISNRMTKDEFVMKYWPGTIDKVN
jgi:hypothetical protein